MSKPVLLRMYEEVSGTLSLRLYQKDIQEDPELHAELLKVRDAYSRAASAVRETLEAYASAERAAQAGTIPEAGNLGEAIERHLSVEPPTSVETKGPPSRVNVGKQLDEATLWGK